MIFIWINLLYSNRLLPQVVGLRWMYVEGGDGAQSRDRTSDTGIFNPLLYRLSYLGTCLKGGLEPRL